MRRREFITAKRCGSGVADGYAGAAGTQAAHHRFLGPSTPAVESQRLAAFLDKLRDLGWIEGQTVAIEIAWGEGRSERFAEIAGRFVRSRSM